MESGVLRSKWLVYGVLIPLSFGGTYVFVTMRNGGFPGLSGGDGVPVSSKSAVDVAARPVTDASGRQMGFGGPWSVPGEPVDYAAQQRLLAADVVTEAGNELASSPQPEQRVEAPVSAAA